MRGGSLRLPIYAAVATATSSVALGSLFLKGIWFWPTLAGIVVVTAGCEGARRLSLSRTAVPLGGVVALLLFLLVRYGHSEAYLGIVPSAGSLDRLGELASRGRADIQRYAAPIGISVGIEMLTVAGVGLVAVLVDMFAVTMRRAALAGLPLLVLQTVPTAIAPDGVSWVAFAIGATGFLALLLAESRERVSRWGRPMRYTAERANYRPDVETAPLGQVGRRVGATALGLALVVPALLPDIDASGWGFGSGGFGPGSGGGQEVAVINPILDLGRNLRRQEDQLVIRYRGKPTYLRLVGLDQFTGKVWRPSELHVSREDDNVEDGLQTAPGLGSVVERTPRTYRIEIDDLDQEWLPLPYPARRVSIDGTWLYDRVTFNVFGENASTRDLSYTVRALDVEPTADQLREAADASYPSSLRRFLDLPNDIPPEVVVQMQDVVGDLTNHYDQALAIQDWLRDTDNFTYSEDVADTVGDANGSQAIAAFLQTRQGYCVHFASTMAVMARMLDIPARVAVGFTAGTADGKGNRNVGLKDAHAWPELYFEGVGWVAFEPTPATRTGAPPPWARGGGPSTPGSVPSSTATASPGANGNAPDSPRNRERTDIPGFGDTAGGGGNGGIGAGPVRVPVLPLAIGVGVLLLLLVPSVTRIVVRRRRWAAARTPVEQARAAWAELQDTLVDHGYVWRASDSPRKGIGRLVAARGLTGEAADAGSRLADVTERTRYAPVTPESVGDVRGDVDTIRRAMGESSGRWARWRARLLPRSTRAVTTALAERMADGLDAVDNAVAAVTSRLRLRRT